LSKIIEIENSGNLLELVDSKLIFESHRSFSGYFSNFNTTSPEFRAEVGREKLTFSLRPIIHPSRKLLGSEKIGPKELLICPHIADPLASDLRQQGIAHADLNGRLFILTGESVIDFRPGEIRYRSERKGPDPFSPKASRIVRSLLCRSLATVTQEELATRTGTSRALVSKVLGQLLDDELVRQVSTSAPGHPAYYQLTNFDRLLDTWAKSDQWHERATVHEYSILSNKPEEIARKLTESVGTEPLAFTQWFAAWNRRPYTTAPLVSCYVKKRQILEIVPARRVKNGGNLWLIVPDDEGVWQDSQEANGFPLVSDVQIYLDLLQVGQRGPETAEELRKWEGFAK